MNIPQEPKKHHFVPQVYLKNFCLNGKLYILDVKKVQKGYKEAPTQKTTGQICYFENYYRIGEELGNSQFQLDTYDALHIELEVFRRLENRYPKIIEKLSSHQALTLQDAVDLADFIIQLKLRNPYWLKNTLDKKKDVFIDSAIDSLVADRLADDNRFRHIPIGIKKAVAEYIRAENKENPKLSKQIQLFGLIQRAINQGSRNEKIRVALVDCKWMLYEAPDEGPYFITSDNPGYSLKGDDGLTYNTNFTYPFVFFLPISPKQCLVVSGSEKDLAYSKKKGNKIYKWGAVSPDLVISINNSSMQCVNNLLLAFDSWYLSQILVINTPDRNSR